MENWILFQKRHRSAVTAAVAAMAFGVITHLFALTNVIHNYDDIASMPGGYGIGVSLGRWFLQILGEFVESLGLNYNLPTVNGLIFLTLLAVSAGFLVDFFQIRGQIPAAAMGMLFVAFPTVASTLFFRYTVPFYGLGVLLAVLAAWILRKNRFGFVLSVLCITLSMGIYQAYVPLTIGMFVLQLIVQALDGKTTVWDLIRNGLYDCAVLILGVGLYMVCQKVATSMAAVSLGAYRGVDTMGQISLTQLPELIWRALKTVLNLPFQDFAGVAVRKIQKLNYVLLGLLTVMMIGMILITRVRKVHMVFAVAALGILFLIGADFIVVMCSETTVYTLMVYGLVLIGCAPLVIYDNLPQMEGVWEKLRPLVTKLLAAGMALLIFCYAYYTNTNYTALYYANRQIENYVNSITVQVRMTEGFDTEKKWAFLGEIEDPLLNCLWEEETTYGGNGFTEYLLNQYSQGNWFRMYVGYKLPMVSAEAAAALHESDAVKAMPCWPNQGSIQVIDDTVVVKFQEIQE